MDRNLYWKAVEQCLYFNVVLVVFQFYPVCNFGKLINFGLGTVRCERFKIQIACRSKLHLYKQFLAFIIAMLFFYVPALQLHVVALAPKQ